MVGTSRRTSGRGVALVVMAKAPRPGAVKTRLCPPLSSRQAARLQRAFLLDTLDRVRAVATPVAAFAPVSERRYFERTFPGLVLVPQRHGDLGRRVAATLGRLLGRGFRAVLVLGADAPTVPVTFLRRAIRLVLHPRIDVVVGPAEDGGYYLIGMRAVHRALFESIPWSTARVFAETVRRAEAARLRVARLPRWYDIDTPRDLRRLTTSLARGGRHCAPRTARLLLGSALAS